jgi:pyrimidine-specific ribonucleoside hydrolase
VEVTLGILAMFERNDIPVACDPERPTDAGDWPQAFVAGNDALVLGLPDPIGTIDSRPAHKLIADVIAASDQPVVLYAVAPLTNIARLVANHAETVEDLDQIVIMGGAVDAPGNVAGTAAEWNLWIDVPAAASVIASGADITMVPLDATNFVPTPGFWSQDLDDAQQSAAVAYLSSMVRVFPSVTSGFFYLWDELAATIAAGKDLATTVDMNLVVVEEPGADFGSTVRDPEGPAVKVATAVPDPDGFYAHFLTTISGKAAVARSTFQLTEESAPQSVGPASSAEEVLAYWLVKSLAGEAEQASTVVAAGAPGVGLGESPDSFVEGSEPYGTFETQLACTSAGNHALCNTTWNDLWIDANPDLDHGQLRARAEVVNGVIVAFEEFAFSPEVVAAFDNHLAWLATEFPDLLNRACGIDSASRDCSELLVSTVSEWVASG